MERTLCAFLTVKKCNNLTNLSRYVWSDGEKYVGEWKLDKKHGKGEKTWTTGEIYRGEYQDDVMQGSGTKEYPSGAIQRGRWLQNVFQS